MLDNTTGTTNVAVGHEALRDNEVGNNNVAVGKDALLSNTTSQNTAVGKYCLAGVTSGAQNTGLGYNAGDNITTGEYNITIGAYADASSATASGECTLGDGNISTLRCNDTSISSLSDARDKTDVVDLPVGLNFLNTLRPVKFKWETRDGNIKDGTVRAGFLAQELQVAQNDSDAEYLDLVMDTNPDKLEAKYAKLVPVLVQAVKELSTQVKQLQTA